jgi:class 3 adenylate cyclase
MKAPDETEPEMRPADKTTGDARRLRLVRPEEGAAEPTGTAVTTPRQRRRQPRRPLPLTRELGVAERTVLVADLRDFTGLCERLSEQEVVAFLNDFYRRVAAPIGDNHGAIVSHTGDGFIVLFDSPPTRPGPPARAVSCAAGLREVVGQLNEERTARGARAVELGIGIATGPVAVARIGAPRRRTVTIAGDTVNVAAGLEQATKLAGVPVLTCEATFRKCRRHRRLKVVGGVRIKGRRARIRAYTPRLAPPRGERPLRIPSVAWLLRELTDVFFLDAPPPRASGA